MKTEREGNPFGTALEGIIRGTGDPELLRNNQREEEGK